MNTEYPYGVINVPKPIFKRLRRKAAEADKGPGVYATMVLKDHLDQESQIADLKENKPQPVV